MTWSVDFRPCFMVRMTLSVEFRPCFMEVVDLRTCKYWTSGPASVPADATVLLKGS